MSDRSIGQLVGNRYRLTDRISSGGMGEVYKAADAQLFNRTVAIKLLTQNFGNNDQLRLQMQRRFEEEAQVSVLLGEHPRIIKVMDYGLDDNYPFLVMEYLGKPPSGWDLGDLIRKEGPLESKRAIRLARQICSGLHHAHCFTADLPERNIRGVLHRDIKPSNIFVLADDTLGESVKILDFGIAKTITDVTMTLGTQMGFVGTPGYASPEQLRGEVLTVSSDIYSLGVVIYQMLTGEMPIQPQTLSFAGWYEAHNYYQPRPIRDVLLPHLLPEALEDVVMSCLTKDPKHRPASMQILSERLEATSQPLSRSRSSASTFIQEKAQRSTEPLKDLPQSPPSNPPQTASVPEGFTAPAMRVILSAEQQSHLQALLLKAMGPIAPLLLQDVLEQAQTSQEFVVSLAQHVQPNQQESLQRQIWRILDPVGTSEPPQTTTRQNNATQAPSTSTQSKSKQISSGQTRSTVGFSSTQLTPEFVQHCERELVQVVGPVAQLVIRQILDQNAQITPIELVDALASQIPHSQRALEFRKKLLPRL